MIKNHTSATTTALRLGKRWDRVGRACGHWMLGWIRQSRKREGARQVSHLAQGPAIAASLEMGRGDHLAAWLIIRTIPPCEAKQEVEGFKRNFQSEDSEVPE